VNARRVIGRWSRKLRLRLARLARYQEPRWLGEGQENVVAPTVLEGTPRVCASYAEVAGRVVNGWYLSEIDSIGYGIAAGTVEYSRSVPKRAIVWRCASSGLYLELHLPAGDERHQHTEMACRCGSYKTTVP